MTPLFRLLQRLPAVRRLRDERDGLRADQNAMQLKLRAASAEMGVLEEQCRVLRRERDQLTETAARRAVEHGAQIDAALLANAALLKERDALIDERGRTARLPDERPADDLDRAAGPIRAG